MIKFAFSYIYKIPVERYGEYIYKVVFIVLGIDD